MAATPPPTQKNSSVWRHVFAGTTLAMTILLGTYAGMQVDRHWTKAPLGLLLGAFLGMGIGFYNFYKEFIDDNSKSNPGR